MQKPRSRLSFVVWPKGSERQLTFTQRFRIARKGVNHVEQVTPYNDRELYGMVQQLCQQNYISAPNLYVWDNKNNQEANAMALPGNIPTLMISRGARELLTPEELKAVIGHELQHILNDQAGVKLSPHQEEFMADQGAIMMGCNPVALVSALKKMDTFNNNLNNPHAGYREHPRLDERAYALGITPEQVNAYQQSQQMNYRTAQPIPTTTVSDYVTVPGDWVQRYGSNRGQFAGAGATR